MANEQFLADIDEFVRKSEAMMGAVVKTAVQDVITEILKPVGQGGRMRVDTGFLRASAQVSLNQPLTLIRDRPSGEGHYEPRTGEISLAIASMQPGDTVFMTFAASYAYFREVGSRGQPPDAFVRTAAGRWQLIVNEAVRKVQQAFQESP